MSRYMSIDYGEKRVGIAITDHLKLFVTPLVTIANQSEEYLFSELFKIIKEQEVERIIIGLPLNIEGEDTDKTKEVRNFYDKLSNLTKLPLVFFDERYSSTVAEELLKNKGLNWRESKNSVDMIAAAVILNDYLNNR